MSWTRVVAKLRVAQARDRVIFVKALLRLGGRLDVPFDHRRAERPGDLAGKHRLSGPGLALHQQWPLENDRGVDRGPQVVGGHIVTGTFEAHRIVPLESRGFLPVSVQRREAVTKALPNLGF